MGDNNVLGQDINGQDIPVERIETTGDLGISDSITGTLKMINTSVEEVEKYGELRDECLEAAKRVQQHIDSGKTISSCVFQGGFFLKMDQLADTSIFEADMELRNLLMDYADRFKTKHLTERVQRHVKTGMKYTGDLRDIFDEYEGLELGNKLEDLLPEVEDRKLLQSHIDTYREERGIISTES